MTTDTLDPRWAALRCSDLRGLAQLGTDATLGITDVAEQLHATIAGLAMPLGRARKLRTTGVTGAVYGSVRGITRLVSWGVGTTLRVCEHLERSPAASEPREALVAAINGIWGDHLEATANPLAIPMRIRTGGRPVDLTAAGLRSLSTKPRRRIALTIHGLCMSDLQWRRHGHDHGAMLARELGYASLAVNYNTGRHVSDNGEQLAGLVERVVSLWPVPVEELVIVGHSMGGLVARSACHAAAVRRLSWPGCLTRLVCLGTPHHGALLERGGHLFDSLLELSPYAAPFARLGKARSAGITDLRFGNVRREDWAGRHPSAQALDHRWPTPLPAGPGVYCVAATTADRPRGLRHAVVGDGLVSLASAWGEHRDRRLELAVPASHKLLVTRAGHLDLLSHPEVAHALRRWLK